MTLHSVATNTAFCIFNLLPTIPMDAARIIWNLLPRDKAIKYEATEKYYFLIILVLIFTNVLQYIISPIRIFILKIFDAILNLNIIGYM